MATDGTLIEVLHPGMYNRNQGPDFLNGRIRVNQTLWVGSIEIHVKSSDWMLHQHNEDPHYKNVILHVVWQNDKTLLNDFYTVELCQHVPKLLLQKFEYLKNNEQFIPCENLLSQIPELTITKCKETMMTERLMEKSEWIIKELQQLQGDWERVCMIVLARCFGGKVNADAFDAMIRSLPLGLPGKVKHQLSQLEAIFFGQAGMLSDELKNEYPRLLLKEYQFLSKKYGLAPTYISMQYLRMRPGSFPALRIAQLCRFIHQQESIMSSFISSQDFDEMANKFRLEAGPYWNNHYRFDETSVLKLKQVGEHTINHLMINAVIPLIFAYGTYNGMDHLKIKAMEWMEKAKAESNGVIIEFQSKSIPVENALDSQALLQLKKRYCDEKKCLNCIIGNYIFRNAA